MSERYERLLTQGEIEASILQIDGALDTATHEFADLSEAAARAEADYKQAAATEMVRLANSDRKMTVSEREARVDQLTADEFAIYRIADARVRAAREGLHSYRARLDALRTISANIRSLTAN